MTAKALVRALVVVVMLFIPFLWPFAIYLGWRWYKEGDRMRLQAPVVPVEWTEPPRA